MHKSDLKLSDGKFFAKFKKVYYESYKKDKVFVYFIIAVFCTIVWWSCCDIYAGAVPIAFFISFVALIIGIKTLFIKRIFFKKHLIWLTIIFLPIVFYCIVFALIITSVDTDLFSVDWTLVITNSKFNFINYLVVSEQNLDSSMCMISILIIVLTLCATFLYSFITNEFTIPKVTRTIDKIFTPTQNVYEDFNNKYFKRAIRIKNTFNIGIF